MAAYGVPVLQARRPAPDNHSPGARHTAADGAVPGEPAAREEE